MNTGLRMMSLVDWLTDIYAAKGIIGVNIDVGMDALRKTAIDFCNQTCIWEYTGSWHSQTNVADYPIEVLPNTRVALMSNVFVDGLELNPSNYGRFHTWPHGTDPDSYHAPGYSVYAVEGKDFVWISPVPQSDSKVIEVRTALKPTQKACDLPEFLYEDWNDALTAGTASRLFIMPKQEWSNPALAIINQKEYAREKARARQFKTQGNTQAAMVMTGSYF